MESSSQASSLEHSLFLALMGNHQAALSHLPKESKDARTQAAKGALFIALGQYQKAVDALDGDVSGNAYVRLALARALFLNGECERAAIEA